MYWTTCYRKEIPMSFKHTLGWNNYPDELDTSALRRAFDNSDKTGVFSSRNTIKKANPSKSLLKSIFHLLPGSKSNIQDVTLHTSPDASTLQVIFSSSSSINTSYCTQYEYADYSLTAELIHKCPGFSGHNLCYHSVITIAIALLHFKPDSEFSKSFKELVTYINQNGSDFKHDPILIKNLIITHDELYFDIIGDIVPSTEDSLTLNNSEPSLLRGGQFLDIHNVKGTFTLPQITMSEDEFHTSITSLEEYILNSSSFFG